MGIAGLPMVIDQVNIAGGVRLFVAGENQPRGSQALSATEIDFRCLNRDVPEEKLDLFEFTPGQMAKACTRATKIVRSQFLDSCRAGPTA
jgi:hypothetical protein